MERPIDTLRATVGALAQTLDPGTYALVPTTRELFAIVDKRFETQARAHRWFAVISGPMHIYPVADIHGQRIALSRFIRKVENPSLSYADLKAISFRNKISFDCRLENLDYPLGRQAMMRNRRAKSTGASPYKGVIKSASGDGPAKWRVQIKGDNTALHLGVYENEREAAMVYDAAAYLLFDGAGHYNLPDLCPDPEALKVARSRIERARMKAIRLSCR